MRPLGPWLEPITQDRASSFRFKAPWIATLDLLSKETELLGAQLVVLQIDVREGDVRRDGMLRANAKVDFPGVRVSFDSVHGPLTYATDAYEQVYSGAPPGWQANIRAIALALGALRAVDRYGVTSRGEQYTGWRAIEAGPAAGQSFGSAEEAAHWLAEEAGHPTGGVRMLADPGYRREILRSVVMKHHPDRGGARADWDRYEAARQLVEESSR